MALVRIYRHIRSAAAVVVARAEQAENTRAGCGSGQPVSRHFWSFLFPDGIVIDDPGAAGDLSAAAANAKPAASLHIHDHPWRRPSREICPQKARLAMGDSIPYTLRRDVVRAASAVSRESTY